MSRKNRRLPFSGPSPFFPPRECKLPGRTCSRTTRRFFRRVLFKAALLLIVWAAFPLPGVAQTLQGVVVDRKGDAKPFVSVDIAGVRRVLTRTGQDGEFTVGSLPKGSYIVTIREGRNRQEFTVTIRGEQNSETFQLGW